MAPRRRWDAFHTSEAVMKPSLRGGADNYRAYVTISCPYCDWTSADLSQDREPNEKGGVCRAHLAASPECAAQFGPFAPVQRKRRAVPASPEAEARIPPEASPAVAVGTPVGPAPSADPSLERSERIEAKLDKVLKYMRVFERHGFKESSGSEDDGKKPERAMRRFQENIGKAELRKTAVVMGLQPAPATETLPQMRKRFKVTLQAEAAGRRKAEFRQKQDTAFAAYAEHKYDEVCKANAEMHATVDEMKKGPPAATNKPPRDDCARRQAYRLVHPDRIPANLRDSPQVQEYSTALAQRVEDYFPV